jgi:hypothetical protein
VVGSEEAAEAKPFDRLGHGQLLFIGCAELGLGKDSNIHIGSGLPRSGSAVAPFGCLRLIEAHFAKIGR